MGQLSVERRYIPPASNLSNSQIRTVGRDRRGEEDEVEVRVIGSGDVASAKPIDPEGGSARGNHRAAPRWGRGGRSPGSPAGERRQPADDVRAAGMFRRAG